MHAALPPFRSTAAALSPFARDFPCSNEAARESDRRTREGTREEEEEKEEGNAHFPERRVSSHVKAAA
jgi:hypothetical protein